MYQAPTWLPFRIRSWIDQRRVLHALRGLDKTRPYPLHEPEKADAEIHLLVGSRDVKLAVMAIKSLLRFDQMKLAGTITQDGSLDVSQLAYISHHLPGARLLSFPDADPGLQGTFERHPLLAELYQRKRFEMAAKMIHPIVLARHPRQIQMDADTAFFKPPQRIIDFVKGDDARPLYMHDHQDEVRNIRPDTQAALAAWQAQFQAPGRDWGVSHRFFNAGLLVYRTEHLDLALMEKYLQWLSQQPEAMRTGQPGIWFGDWTREQTGYHVMYALAQPSPVPLGDDYWLGDGDGKVFNHFLRHYIVRKPVLEQLRQLVATF